MTKTTGQTGEVEVVDEEDGAGLPAVVTQRTTSVSRLTDDQSQALEAFLVEMNALGSLDPEQAAMEIVATVLTGRTVEEILAEPVVLHAEHIVNVPITLHDVRFNRSDYQGIGVYAMLDTVSLENGEHYLVSCGATRVLAQAYKLADIGALPCDVMLKRSERPTAAGYHPMWLVMVPLAKGA